jgi:hypothetical protein
LFCCFKFSILRIYLYHYIFFFLYLFTSLISFIASNFHIYTHKFSLNHVSTTSY